MKPPAQAGFRPIEDYALIGDCRACALVSGEGSIDWLCLPRFDSPAIFASLIHSDGGRFAIRPDEPFRSSRHYRPDSNVLTTRFETDSGAFEVTDLFFASSQRRSALLPVSMLIRKVRGLTGKVPATVTFEPRKNFGLERFELRRPRNSASPRRSLVFQSMDGAFHLAADFDLELTADGAEARLAVEEGQSHVLILSFNENAPAVAAASGDGNEQQRAQ